MTNGYWGRLLKINLTNSTTSVETLDDHVLRTWVGGRGLALQYLYRNTVPGVNPLGADNPLIFSTGPLTGTPFPGAGRNSVNAKSPLTGAFGSSEAGGHWGAELKKAGYDALVIEGVAQAPVYLCIDGSGAEIKDASHLWGKPTEEVQAILVRECGFGARIAQIGPAGEKLVSFACIVNDLRNFAGRTGLGAVMGSKKLRAVVVRGSQRPPVYDLDAVRGLARSLGRQLREKPANLSLVGTAGSVKGLNSVGGLPTRNFRSGSFAGVEGITADALKEKLLISRETCYGCPVRCKPVVALPDGSGPVAVSPYGGPEYETIAALGSNCGVGDIVAIARANEICSAYAMDAISAGAAVAFAMEAYENGLIGPLDTGGVELRFGNACAMVEAVRMIADRSGIGDLLAGGVKKAAEKIGGEHYAMHVKGQEIPMHEPRIKFGLGLGYAVSPTGADHCHNMHDTVFMNSINQISPLGITETLNATEIGPEKVRMFAYHSTWRHFMDTAVLCNLVPWGINQVVEALKAATGWNTSLWEMMKAGERVVTLARLYNIREGLDREDDNLPERFFRPPVEGSVPRAVLESGPFKDAVTMYYGMMGWDRSGTPRDEKLAELGIGWACPGTLQPGRGK